MRTDFAKPRRLTETGFSFVKRAGGVEGLNDTWHQASLRMLSDTNSVSSEKKVLGCAKKRKDLNEATQTLFPKLLKKKSQCFFFVSDFSSRFIAESPRA